MSHLGIVMHMMCAGDLPNGEVQVFLSEGIPEWGRRTCWSP